MILNYKYFQSWLIYSKRNKNQEEKYQKYVVYRTNFDYFFITINLEHLIKHNSTTRNPYDENAMF